MNIGSTFCYEHYEMTFIMSLLIVIKVSSFFVKAQNKQTLTFFSVDFSPRRRYLLLKWLFCDDICGVQTFRSFIDGRKFALLKKRGVKNQYFNCLLLFYFVLQTVKWWNLLNSPIGWLMMHFHEWTISYIHWAFRSKTLGNCRKWFEAYTAHEFLTIKAFLLAPIISTSSKRSFSLSLSLDNGDFEMSTLKHLPPL